jgi:ABC-2 type transport system permease protein
VNNPFRDTYLILKNELLVTIRNPFWIFFGLFQPIVYLVLFAPFLKGVANLPGDNPMQFYAPGLLVMNAMFNSGFAGFGLLERLESGFLERLRVTPVSRLSLVLGVVLLSATTVLVQSALLCFAASFFGLRVSLPGALLMAILLLLISVTMASISFSLALIVKEGGILAGVTNFFTLPLLLLSGVMLPVNFAPPFIQSLAKADPFAHAVNAARALLNGTLLDPSVPTALIIFLALASLALTWFIRTMRQAVA